MSRVCSNERIVWAKLRGYKHWPARIIPEELGATNADYKEADSYKAKSDDTLVWFFGTHNIAWVNSKKAVVPWKEGKRLSYHRPKMTSKKNSKKYSKEFNDAVDEVRKFCLESSDSPFAAQV